MSILNHFIDNDFPLIAGRVFLALVLSGLIGFEREMKNHSAGFRTHILVGVGSCLMMVLSLHGFEAYIHKYFDVANIRFDPSRIPAYVISGIGFLGAGTIIVYGGTIRGLTTAASIWIVAGLGLIVGIGMYAIAVFTTLIILLSLSLLNNFERFILRKKSSGFIKITAKSDLQLSHIVSIIESLNLKIDNLKINKGEVGLKNILISLKWSPNQQLNELFDEISKLKHIKGISKSWNK